MDRERTLTQNVDFRIRAAAPSTRVEASHSRDPVHSLLIDQQDIARMDKTLYCARQNHGCALSERRRCRIAKENWTSAELGIISF
jgi:hypothetical protein